MGAVSKIQNNERYTAWTKATFKMMLKTFFRWLKKTGDEQPEETKWISTKVKRTEKNNISNGELITEEEIKRAISVMDHPRNKALISTLYESGARVGEIGSLQIGNVNFDKHGAIITVEGKTGSRQVRLISSTGYLSTWLNNHPFKDNPKAPLWTNIGSTNNRKLMKYGAISKVLRTSFQKAGIKKKYNPHLFRHSRATFLADHLTEFQMNQYLGWIQGSKMPSTYIHLSGKQMDASMLALNGFETQEFKQEPQMKPLHCPRCETINSHDSKFCMKCGGILDIKTAMQMEEVAKEERKLRVNTDDAFKSLMKDPEFARMVAMKIKEIGMAGKVIS